MSCKLLLNLVECIKDKSDTSAVSGGGGVVQIGSGRQLLIKMLHVFVLKFKSISKIQLPFLLNKR